MDDLRFLGKKSKYFPAKERRKLWNKLKTQFPALLDYVYELIDI